MSIYQFVVKATYATVTELRNVVHYEVAGAVPTTAQLQNAVNDLDADYKDALQIHLPDEVNFYEYTVRRVDIGDQPEFAFVPDNGAWSGTQGADILPAQLAALVTWKAPTTYPRTCRSYMFPFTESNNSSGGQVSATLVTALETFADDALILAQVGFDDFVKVTVRYGGDPRVVTASNVVTTIFVAKEWATQRSRRKGVGI